MGVEALADEPLGVDGADGLRLGQTDDQVAVPGALVCVGLDLLDERRHEVEGGAHAGNVADGRDHAPVVLQGVQPHPRQDRLPGERVEVVRLVHVPEQGEADRGMGIRGCWYNPAQPRMRTLDRYVLRETLAPFALALLVLTFILIIPFIIAQAETMIAKGVPWLTVAQVMVHAAAAGPRAHHPDGAAGRACWWRWAVFRATARWWRCWPAGSAPSGCCARPWSLGTVAWAATSWVMLWAIPDANQTFRELTTRLVADRAEGEVKPRVFFEDFPGFVVYVREVPAAGGWTGVLAADTRSPEHPVLFLAARGRMLVDRAQRTIQMVLTDGTRHATSARDPDGYEVVRFGEIVLSLDPESVFPRAGPARGEREMSIAELRTRADTLARAGYSPHNPLMEIHKKFSIPAACLVFTLIGVALGASHRKDGKFASFVVGIGGDLRLLGPAAGRTVAGQGPVHRTVAGRVAAQPGAGRGRDGRPAAPGGGGPPPAGDTAAGRPCSPPAARNSRRPSVVSRVPDLTWLRPTLLDLYVGLLYLRMLGLGLAGMAGLFYISTFIDLSDHLFKGTATVGMLFAYLWWATPQFLYYIIAIAVLLAALVTIGALTKSSELIVMRACGISLYRTAVPLLVAARAPRRCSSPSRSGCWRRRTGGPAAELHDSRAEPADDRRPQPQVAHRRGRRALPLPVLQPA